jgi:orotidine-5'-phosphate decarboxylase
MTRQDIIAHIHEKQSFLCVGLDPDFDKIPKHLKEEKDWILQFNRVIIDAVAPYCVAFKPNTAFYECYGSFGWAQFEQTVDYIRTNYPRHFIIADAKRGDIGNTSDRYARAFFQTMDCDAITVAPYMGSDSVKPFLSHAGRWVILLGLTSNAGSADFQHYGESPLFTLVIRKAMEWGTPENMMIVAGATRGEDLAQVRAAAGSAFLLVPGVGAQGGSLQDVVQHAFIHDEVGLLVNSSRAIIYAGDGADFGIAAKEAASDLAMQMAQYL